MNCILFRSLLPDWISSPSVLRIWLIPCRLCHTNFDHPQDERRVIGLWIFPVCCFQVSFTEEQHQDSWLSGPFHHLQAGSLELSQRDCFYEQTSVSSSYLTISVMYCSRPQKCHMVLVQCVWLAVLSWFLQRLPTRGRRATSHHRCVTLLRKAAGCTPNCQT